MSYEQQRKIYDADLAATEAEMPCEFTVDGATFIGQKTPKVAEVEMFETGYKQRDDFDLSVRLSQFADAGATPPGEQSILVIDGVEYQVEKVTTDQPGIEALYGLKACN